MTASRPDPAGVALGGVLLLHAALWLRWMSYAEIPAGAHDEFQLVELTTEIVYGWGATPWEEMRGYLLADYYPPLSKLPGVVALALGGGYRAMVAAQLPWALLLIAAVAWATRGWGRVGAVGLLLAAPSITDALHRFEPTLGAAACTAAALVAWSESEDLTRRRETLAVGVFVGLGLLVDRLGAAPFVAGPVLLSMVRRRERATWLGAALVAAAAVAVAGWWYALYFIPHHLAEIVEQVSAGEVSALGARSEGQVTGLARALHYLVLWPDTQLGLVGGLVGFGALGAGLSGRTGPRGRDLALAVAVGLALFTLPAKHQPYYTAPLLPIVAVLAGLALERVKGRAGLAGALVLICALPTLSRSRAHPDLPRGAALGWLVAGASPLPESLVGERYPIGAEPLGVGLDVPGLVAALEAAGVRSRDPVAVWSDSAAVSESQLLALLRTTRRTLHADGVTVDPETFEQHLDRVRALVTVQAAPGPCAPPDPASVREQFEVRFGWEDRPALLRGLADLASGAPVVDRELGLDARLCAWTR